LKAENIQQVSNLSLSIPLDSVAQLGGGKEGQLHPGAAGEGRKTASSTYFL